MPRVIKYAVYLLFLFFVAGGKAFASYEVPKPARKPDFAPAHSISLTTFAAVPKPGVKPAINPGNQESGLNSETVKKQLSGLTKDKKWVQALDFLKGQEKMLETAEYDRLSGKIAAGLYYDGHIKEAGQLAARATTRSREEAPMASWISGLCAWRYGDYTTAASHFAFSAASPRSPAGLESSAAAYWSARAYARSGDNEKAKSWYNVAAKIPHSFYGFMAMHALNSLDYYQRDMKRYPVGNWIPAADYSIDPALIHAIIRQESKFNASAVSPGGAHGLMQLLPATASYITGDPALKSAQGSKRLLDPKTNLRLGQRYITNLLNDKSVNGDIIGLLIAYNAGPGTYAKWKQNMGTVEDSLLIMESIPSSQVRGYVAHVVSNYWMYQLRENAPLDSLESLAAGSTAHYPGYGGKKVRLVSAN